MAVRVFIGCLGVFALLVASTNAVTSCIQGSSSSAAPAACSASSASCIRTDSLTRSGGVTSSTSVYSCSADVCSSNTNTNGQVGCYSSSSNRIDCCCETNDCNSKDVSKFRVKKCASSFGCLEEGADCYDAGTKCGSNLYCDPATFTCKPPPTTCQRDSDCVGRTGMVECVAEVCKVVQAIGAACETGDRCQSHQAPFTANSDCPAQGNCPGLGRGDACSTTCSPGLDCIGGQCRAAPHLPAAGQPCSASVGCALWNGCLIDNVTTGVCHMFGSQAVGVNIGASTAQLCASLTKDSNNKCAAVDSTDQGKTCGLGADAPPSEVSSCPSSTSCQCSQTGSTKGLCLYNGFALTPKTVPCLPQMAQYQQCLSEPNCRLVRNSGNGTICPACCKMFKSYYNCMQGTQACSAPGCPTWGSLSGGAGQMTCHLTGCQTGSASSLAAPCGAFLALAFATIMMFV